MPKQYTGAWATQTAFDADFQTFITETAWGTVWARPDWMSKRTTC
jgi:alkylhydroperoxidase/carboxymuconolactone decarboxylase family protein YurZ